MIDLSKEEAIKLSNAARELPRRRAGKKPHTSTLYRWASRGFRGVHLEVIRIGSTLCTSREALQRFFDRITEADSLLHAPPHSGKSRSVGDDAQNQIENQLNDLGV